MSLLQGVRILDWTNTVAGPLATRLLADLGAEVIRIEQVPTGSELPRGMRSHAAYLGSPTLDGVPEPWNAEGTFNSLNRGKLSLPLNLQQAEGREVFRKLVKQSDGLVTNFSARVMPNLDLDYAELKRLNPAFVCVSITGYGRTGPKSNHVAYGPIIESESGLASLSSYPDAPVVTKNVYVDAATATQSFTAFLQALEHSSRTGDGQLVDISMLETIALLLGDEFFQVRNGHSAEPLPTETNEHPEYVPHGCYPCSEGEWVAIAVRSDDEWKGLTDVLSIPFDSSLKRAPARRARQGEIQRLVSAATRHRSVHDLAEQLRALGIPAEPVNHAPAILRNDNPLLGDDFFEMIGNGLVPELPHAGSPFLIDGRRERAQLPPPRFGEHTDMILTEILGLDVSDVRRMEEHGAIFRGD